ncbi:MAG: hypothetical protein GEV08_16805 [Acidimicrobiia bacterium]|nr:hypothetical protein [Acidimicrobiia bacterium]
MHLEPQRTPRRLPTRPGAVVLLLVAIVAAACGGGDGQQAPPAVGEGADGAAVPTTTTTAYRPSGTGAAFGAELSAGMTAQGRVAGPVTRTPAAQWSLPVLFTAVKVSGSAQTNVLVADVDLLCESGVPARPSDHLGVDDAVRVTRAGTSAAGDTLPGGIAASLVMVAGC